MADDNGYYTGPSKDDFLERLARYEGIRFEIMRLTSQAGKVLEEWEKRGGDKKDIKDGYSLRQMTVEEQRAELRRQFRVAGWIGAVDEDAAGQRSFLAAFDAPPVEPPTGIGGAPLGSDLSRVRALSAGFNDGRARKGPGLQDGIELYGFEADSPEALAYAEGWGQGFELRPPSKPSRAESAEDAEDGDLNAEIAAELAAQDAPQKRGRGRPRKQPAGGDNVVPMAWPETRMLPAPDVDDDPFDGAIPLPVA